MRFDVLIREGMHKEATGILIAAARDHPQAAHESLRKGLEGLGQTVITDAVNQPGGVSTCLLVSLCVRAHVGAQSTRWIPAVYAYSHHCLRLCVLLSVHADRAFGSSGAVVGAMDFRE